MESIVGLSGANGADGGGDLIKDSNQNDFVQDVIETSMELPVIVDFWAPWCGPCKQLGPALEKVVKAARGAVRMVKVNIDENQELAAQLRIQSIPTVYAFFQGRPLDGFQGAKPESELSQFVKRLIEASGGSASNPISEALEAAEAQVEAGEFDAAMALFGQILQHEPDNRAAMAGLVACHIGKEDIVGARELIDSFDEEVTNSSEFAAVIAQLELAESAASAGPLDELMARVAAHENDHQARFDLAMAQQAAGRSEDAAESLLEIVSRDRTWNDDGARKQLLTFFEAWGATDPLTVSTRRRLSSLLFS
ncbi:MAG: thioredoxin [Pseudomonadota bacterium]